MSDSRASRSTGSISLVLAVGVLAVALVGLLAEGSPGMSEVVLAGLALALVSRLLYASRRPPEPGTVPLEPVGDQLPAPTDSDRASHPAGEVDGVVNRRALVDEYRKRLDEPDGSGTVAVLFIDVDRFKATNDSLGRDYGDQLLRALGRRLLRTVRPGDTVGCLGADEFIVLCDGCGHPDEAVGLAQQIHRALTEPFVLVDSKVTVTVSVGVALGTDECAESAFSNADIAMMQAKEAGGSTTVVFSASLRDEVAERAVIEQELRRALANDPLAQDELLLVYQPIVDLVEGRMAAVEALVRWNHPERGRLSPAAFLPVAEETGLIVPLGEMVLAKACHAQVSWRALLGEEAPTVTVNLSLRQLLTPDFVARVRVHVVKSGIDPSQLILEVTEDSLVNELERCIPVLSELAAIGLGIAIDDFGTGMSSLSYVKRLPMARTLKLDRSFISDIHEYRTDHAIVQAVLVMTNRLGIRVVAEGVETAEQLAALVELGGRYVQGYFFSPPLEAESLPSYAPDLVRVHGLSMGPIG